MATLLDYALCSVADVKENLGISSGDSSKNNLIIRKINAATELIEGYCDRRFKSTSYVDEVYDGSGTDQLLLRNRPISAVTLKVRNTSLNDPDFTTIPTDEYFVNANAGVLDGLSSFYGRADRWAVTYTGGYTTIPSDLQEACATLASFLVLNASSGGDNSVKSKAEGARRVEYHDSAESNDIFDQLNISQTLNRYANPVL